MSARIEVRSAGRDHRLLGWAAAQPGTGLWLVVDQVADTHQVVPASEVGARLLAIAQTPRPAQPCND